MKVARTDVIAACLFACACMTGCVTSSDPLPDQVLAESARRVSPVPGRAQHFEVSINDQGVDARGAPTPLILRGSGPTLPNRPAPRVVGEDGGTFAFNFDNADVRDVVKAVFNDMLGVGYTIDPEVKGQITLFTSKPLRREAVLPAFEEALNMTQATIVSGPSGYQVVPLKEAARRGAFGAAGGVLQPGYQIRVVPLRYINPADVQRVLEPIVSAGTVVQGDAHGATVTLAGTESELVRAEQAIETFDVDWLRTQSFGLFPLRYSTAAEVSEDLGSVIGKDGPLAGAVRIAPIAHLNAILVVSKNFATIGTMRTWIERFDRGRGALKTKIYVYHVQNGRAQDLAKVLNKVFDKVGEKSLGASTEPGTTTVEPASSPVATASSLAQPDNPPPVSPFGNLQIANSSPAIGSSQESSLRITADEENNALIIETLPSRYAQIEAAILQLDAAPLQVLIEASIIEVGVNDTFKYGVQASLQEHGVSSLASSVAAAALGTSTGGLSTAVLRGGIAATIDFLSGLTKVRVISAPKLMVLNNRSASIQVGDQVPVATFSAVSTISPNAPVVNTIQLVDTGIILHVTPRVNAGGHVFMDLSQEVSASVPTQSSSINSPTIQQRRVSTSVVVNDGQTIAIGGLIHDSRNQSRTGIPYLKDLPTIGPLFGVDSDDVERTELMVLLTPRIIRDAADADAATDELSAKLPLLRGMRAPSNSR